jgi:hypothetical protein
VVIASDMPQNCRLLLEKQQWLQRGPMGTFITPNRGPIPRQPQGIPHLLSGW